MVHCGHFYCSKGQLQFFLLSVFMDIFMLYLVPTCCTLFLNEYILDTTANVWSHFSSFFFFFTFKCLTLKFDLFTEIVVSSLLCVRTAHAQGKAEAAVGAAQKAQEESRMARVTAKQFSPSFQHPGNGELTHTHMHKYTLTDPHTLLFLYAAHVHIHLY